jgi:ParB-like chromosome segregation protein Spo0J
MENVNPRNSKVASLREKFQNDGWDNVPIIQVYREGGTVYVINGNHRVVAARQAGLSSVPVLYLDEDGLKSYGYEPDRLVLECAE